MSFARPTQILVSRSYYDVVTRISEDYARLFAYQGSRTDKHVREHELYELVASGAEARDLTRRRSRARRPGEDTLTSITQPRAPLLKNRRLAFAFTGFSIFALGAAALYYVVSAPASRTGERFPTPRVVTTAAPVRPAPAALPPSELSPDAQQPAQPVEAAAAPPSEAAGDSEQHAVKPLPEHRPRTVRRLPAPVEEPVPAVVEAPAAPAQEVNAEPGRDIAQPWKPTVSAPPVPPPGPGGAAGALVQLAISPWGEVFVNGKSAGVSPPLSEIELRPGKYRIEVRNGAFKPYEEEVDLGSNETIRIKHKFSQQR
jgi:hypothetical protein